MLEPYARLLGATVHRLWQLAAVSDDGTIPLPGHLALETGDGFVTLSCTQEGLWCHGPSPRQDVRRDSEPWPAMGWAEGADEWLDLVPPDDQPALPRTVTALTGWFGVGAYMHTYALALSGRQDPLVLMTTDRFDLVCTDVETARDRAMTLAPAMRLRFVEQRL